MLSATEKNDFCCQATPEMVRNIGGEAGGTEVSEGKVVAASSGEDNTKTTMELRLISKSKH